MKNSFFPENFGIVKKTQEDDLIFVLHNINENYIVENYFDSITRSFNESNITKTFITNINDGNNNFLEDKCLALTIGKDKLNILNNKLRRTTEICNDNVKCMYCHLPIVDSIALGIPIEYHSSEYITDIIMDGKKIGEFKKKISRKECENYKDTLKYKLIIKDYYTCVDIVCSFNCMLSLIENEPKILYKNSKQLIYMLYSDIYQSKTPHEILKTPDYKLREDYGGVLSVEEYKKCIQRIKITDLNLFERLNRFTENTNKIYNITFPV